uniref:C-type lectin domain-containing protein n=1 Tax=Parascaris univalens TaxID=6257 RepID=A0A915BL39_PARUN
MLNIFILSLVVGFCFCSQECGSWEQFNGFCYKTFSDALTWQNAELSCQKMNSHLASVHSKEENEFVYGLIKAPRAAFSISYWIGLSADGNKWSWTDGSPVDYLHPSWSSERRRKRCIGMRICLQCTVYHQCFPQYSCAQNWFLPTSEAKANFYICKKPIGKLIRNQYFPFISPTALQKSKRTSTSRYCDQTHSQDA